MIDKEKFDKIYNPDYNRFPKTLDNISLEQYKYVVEELSISGKMLSEYFDVTMGRIEYLRQKFNKLGVKPNKSLCNKLSNLYNYDSETPYNKKDHSKRMKKFWENISKDKLNEMNTHRKQTNLRGYGVEYISQYSEVNKKVKEYWENGGSKKLSDKMKLRYKSKL